MIDVFDFQIQISPDSKTFELKSPVQAVMYQFKWNMEGKYHKTWATYFSKYFIFVT